MARVLEVGRFLDHPSPLLLSSLKHLSTDLHHCPCMFGEYVGGCTWGYRAVYDMYSKGCDEIKGNDRKPLTYLSDLVREGHTDAWIRGLIGECYARGVGCAQDPRVAMLYYVHGIEEGYTSAYKPLLDLLAGIKFHTQSKGHKAMLAQVIAEERKVILDDDRIVALLLRLMLDRHVDFHPKPKELGRFQTKGTAALYYANILIQRGSPVGYLYKGEVYMYGHADLSDWSKAVSIWEEADRQGKANFEIYYKHLQDVYKYVILLAMLLLAMLIVAQCVNPLPYYRWDTIHNTNSLLYTLGMAKVYLLMVGRS